MGGVGARGIEQKGRRIHGHRQPSVMGVWDIRGINSNGKSTIKNHGEKIHEVLFS